MFCIWSSILLLLPMIVVVASYGAILTFPLHKSDKKQPPKPGPD